ncbi:MAG: glycosyltransferase [Candidatus Omnitrophota bacterium]
MKRAKSNEGEGMSFSGKIPDLAPGRTGWPWEEWKGDVDRIEGESSLLPRVSVVIPNLNDGQFLEATIRSVIFQEYPDMEVIVIDSASQDSSVSLIKKYEEHISCWISERDRGVYGAYNKGISMATGEWILFLGSGDVLLDPHVIERMLSFSAENDIIYGNVHWGFYGNVFGEKFSRRKLIKQNICHQSMFFRRSLFSLYGPYDTKYKIFADWVFNMRCFGDKRTRMRYVDTITSFYMCYGKSHIYREEDKEFHEKKFQLAKKYLGAYPVILIWLESNVLDRVKAFLFRVTRSVEMGIFFLRKKQETWNFGIHRAQLICSRKEKPMAKAEIQATVYSFDVFDTCIVRSVSKPTDLFFLLAEKMLGRSENVGRLEGLVRLRIEAEKRARRKADGEDIDISEIYDNFPELQLWGISPKEMMLKEVALEYKLAYPVCQVRSVIEKLRAQGNSIVFISDMYLPEENVRRMLKKCGMFSDGDRLYVSSRSKLTKRTGNLFRHVLKMEKILPHQLVHHGDDSISDVKNPAKIGIHVCKFKDASLTRYEKIIAEQEEGNPGTRSLLGGVSRVSRLSESSFSEFEVMKNIVADVIAPLLTGYVLWLLKDAQRKALKRLYFVSRDGQILMMIAKRLSQNIYCPEIKYLFGSRHAWFLPSVQKCDQAELDWLLIGSRTFREALKKLDIGEEEIRPLLVNHKDVEEILAEELDRSTMEKFWEFIQAPPIVDLIREKSRKARNLTLKYFLQEGLFIDDKWALVDVGWELRCQEAVGKIVRSYKSGSLVRGYYLNVDRSHRRLDNITNLYSTYIDNNLTNHITGRDKVNLSSYRGVIEHMFLLSDHGTVMGYQDDGVKIGPVLKSMPVTNFQNDLVPFSQNMILLYVDKFMENGLIDRDLCDIRDLSPRPAHKFLTVPQKHEAETASKIPIFAEQRHEASRAEPLCRKMTLADLLPTRLKRWGGFRDNIFFTWIEGSLALSGTVVRQVFSYKQIMKKIVRRK